MGVTLSTITNHAGVFDNPVLEPIHWPSWVAPGTLPPDGLPDDVAHREVPGQRTEVKTGFTIGVAVNIAFSERFSLQPELSYIRKGAQTRYSVSAMTTVVGSGVERGSRSWGDGKVTLEYLELPVLARYNFPSKSTIATFFVVAGPVVSMGIGGQVRSDAGYVSYTRNNNTDLSNGSGQSYSEASFARRGSVKFEDATFSNNGRDLYVNSRYDVGAQIGGGVALIQHLVIDVRYSRGFISVYDRYSNARNQTLQVSLGVPLIF
ncbi:porin family protein [Dawidia soli]